MDELLKRHDWWEKREGLDLWSIPHFLFGALMALAVPLLGISTQTGLALTIILGLLWEVYEKLARIEETLVNSVLDMLLPIAAFLITISILATYPVTDQMLKISAAAVGILYMGINTLGWMAYRRRKRGRIL